MAIQATADQGFIRKHNTAVVIDVLRRFAPLSRAELAARSGLNHSTVSLVINGLIEEGFVQETYLQSPIIGRPGMLLVTSPRGGFAVGVEIGVDFISFVASAHNEDATGMGTIALVLDEILREPILTV